MATKQTKRITNELTKNTKARTELGGAAKVKATVDSANTESQVAQNFFSYEADALLQRYSTLTQVSQYANAEECLRLGLANQWDVLNRDIIEYLHAKTAAN